MADGKEAIIPKQLPKTIQKVFYENVSKCPVLLAGSFILTLYNETEIY